MLLSLKDMYDASTISKFDLLGQVFTSLYEDESFLGGPEFDADWRKATDHLIDVFDCLAEGTGSGMSLIGTYIHIFLKK